MCSLEPQQKHLFGPIFVQAMANPNPNPNFAWFQAPGSLLLYVGTTCFTFEGGGLMVPIVCLGFAHHGEGVAEAQPRAGGGGGVHVECHGHHGVLAWLGLGLG